MSCATRMRRDAMREEPFCKKVSPASPFRKLLNDRGSLWHILGISCRTQASRNTTVQEKETAFILRYDR